MKLLLASSAVLYAVSAVPQILKAAVGISSEECRGCDKSPEDPYVCTLKGGCNRSVCGKMPTIDCDGDTCKVDCDLEYGYYPDSSDCRAFCFCSGTDNVDQGTGIRVPSKWARCPEGTIYNNNCQQYHKLLSNGIGWEGGCCSHPTALIDNQCSCNYLGKWHCDRSQACEWGKVCPNCCTPTGKPVTPRPVTDKTASVQFKYVPPNFDRVKRQINVNLGHKYGLVSTLKPGNRYKLGGFIIGTWTQMQGSSGSDPEGYWSSDAQIIRCEIQAEPFGYEFDLWEDDARFDMVANALAREGCSGLLKVWGSNKMPDGGTITGDGKKCDPCTDALTQKNLILMEKFGIY